LTNERLSIFYVSRLETDRSGLGPNNPKIEPPFASSSAISLPRTAVCSGTQNSPTACRVEILFSAFWHCWTKSRRCSDGMKSCQGRLTVTADTHVFLRFIVQLNSVNTAQDSTYLGLKYCCISAKGKVEPACYRLPIDCSHGRSLIFDPSVKQMSPLTAVGAPKLLVQSSPVSIVTL
jgi:hypothetical protein